MGKNSGKPYERLAKQVFEQILNQKVTNTIQVKHDVVLQGRSTKHQIDVYWEFEFGGIVYKTVVQAKDWANPVDQGELLKFKGVIDDLPGQPRGVFVTRTGYQAGAMEYAKSHGIGLYELRAPTDEDWEGKIKTVVIQLHLLKPNYSDVKIVHDDEWLVEEKVLQNIPADEKIQIQIQTTTGELQLFDSAGKPVEYASAAMLRLKPVPGKENAQAVLFEAPTFMRVNHPKIQRIKVKAIEATVTETVFKHEFTIEAGEAVALILKDIIGGNEFAFDKASRLLSKPGH